MTDELVERVARAIWEQQCQHWGRYRDQIPDLCVWDDLTQSKQREVMREAQAAITALQHAIDAARDEGRRSGLEEAAKVAETYDDKRSLMTSVSLAVRAIRAKGADHGNAD